MKQYQFQFSPQGERYFTGLSRNLQRRILRKLLYFEHFSEPLKFAEKLQGVDNTYRFRIGDYRIIVKPRDEGVMIILIILKIGHRREIYRFL